MSDPDSGDYLQNDALKLRVEFLEKFNAQTIRERDELRAERDAFRLDLDHAVSRVEGLILEVDALTRGRDAATKALVELHLRSKSFGAFVRGEYGITSEDEADHNVFEFFAAVGMSEKAISALLALGDAGGG